jgi:hypothetical protein
MNTQKHTPGPWGRNIAPAWKYPIIFAGRNTHVAKLITDELPESEQEANACLIAAAPDLLEIVKAYRNLLRTMASNEGELATFAHIESVLAKATA